MENNKKKKKKNYYKYHNSKNNWYYYKKKKNKKQNYVVDETVKEQEVNNNVLINNEVNNNEEVKENVNSQEIVREVLIGDDDYEEEEFTPVKKVEVEEVPKIGLFKYALGFVLLVALLFGVTYSFFSYNKEDSRQADIASGEVYVRVEEETVNLTLDKMYPRTSEEARSRNDNYVDFTVKAKNTSPNKIIHYSIVVTNGENVDGKTRIDPKYVRIDLQKKVGNEYIYVLEDATLADFLFINTIPVNTTNEITKEYRLRAWIGDDLIISDTEDNKSYTQAQFANLYANFHVEVTSQNEQESLYDILNTSAVIDNENNANAFINNSTPGIDFGEISSDTNGKGLYKRATTVNTEFPINYFRGAVDNNNVYFAGYCWKIVRTTETGGVKLIYAGESTGVDDEHPVCNNTTGATTTILSSTFYGRYKSPAYVGYMFGDAYEWTNAYNNNTSTSDHEGAYFGTGFNYENGVYSLKGAKLGIDSTHHYSCNSTSETGTCESIRYYYYYGVDSGTTYHMYITLTGGDNVLDALNKMKKNVNDSNAKTKIDEWYSLNMTDYTSKLEDTIWCNDRSISSLGGWNESGGDLTSYLIFNGLKRRDTNPRTPSLECQDKNDAFTVSNAKGNKALTYPVALITSDEIMLAGGQAADNGTYYLKTGAPHWSLSPYYFNIINAHEINVYSSGYLHSIGVDYSRGLRPAISLKPGTMIVSGDGGNGTEGNGTPYIIE